MQKRLYQETAIAKVSKFWNEGVRSVLLVAPTGSGKTWMGARLAEPLKSVLWVAHRRELVHQAANKLRELVGQDNVSVVLGGSREDRSKRIQVASVEALMNRGIPRHSELLVLDEAHHYVSDMYKLIPREYLKSKILGLTATPERADGTPLGDIFQELVPAAHYSELIEKGYLVPARVYGPATRLGRHLAENPIAAWELLSEGERTFWFSTIIKDAEEARDKLRRRKVDVELIDWETPKSWRDFALKEFEGGRLRVLTNAYCLTEGVDVPSARVALSTRPFNFAGTMIQAFGRVLRPSEGKKDAIIIDLTGAFWIHGPPDADREYSLKGRPITRKGEKQTQGDPPYHRLQRIENKQMYILQRGALPVGETAPVPELPKSLIDWKLLRRIRSKHGNMAATSASEYMEKLGE